MAGFHPYQFFLPPTFPTQTKTTKPKKSSDALKLSLEGSAKKPRDTSASPAEPKLCESCNCHRKGIHHRFLVWWGRKGKQAPCGWLGPFYSRPLFFAKTFFGVVLLNEPRRRAVPSNAARCGVAFSVFSHTNTVLYHGSSG